MSRDTLLISPQVVKDKTGVNNNLEEKNIIPAIKTAQDVYIQSVLGSDLYRRIQDGKEADNLTDNEKTLLDTYITDCLVWFTISELPIALGYKFFNKNVFKGQSEGQQTPTMSEIIDLEQRYKNKAEFYEQRLLNYLQQSARDNIYPLYTDYGTGRDVIRPKNTAYSTSIYLGGYEGDCTDRRPFWKYNQGEGYD